MKKINTNKMVALLAALCLMTSAFVGGTLAKYVTEGSAADTARVAKWGVVIATSGSLYSDAYAKANDNVPAVWDNQDTADKLSVVAKTEADNIVAPGTKSADTGLSFALTGAPEVDTKAYATIKAQDIYLAAGDYAIMTSVGKIAEEDEYDAKVTAGTLYTYNANTYTQVTSTDTYNSSADYYIISNAVNVNTAYYPVKYTVAGTKASETDKTANELADKLMSLFGTTQETPSTADGVTTYEIKEANAALINANTDLATAIGSHKITWAWAFGTVGTISEDDKKDTILGQMMSEDGITVDPATHGVTVVKDGAAYKTVSVDANTKLVTVNGGAAPVASLKTSFDIKITVAQQD